MPQDGSYPRSSICTPTLVFTGPLDRSTAQSTEVMPLRQRGSARVVPLPKAYAVGGVVEVGLAAFTRIGQDVDPAEFQPDLADRAVTRVVQALDRRGVLRISDEVLEVLQ